MKKKMLIVYPGYFIGGSTSSIKSFINNIDFSLYEVFFLSYTSNRRELFQLPSEVKVIECYPKHRVFDKMIKFCRYLVKGYLFKSIVCEIKYNKRFGLNRQVLSQALESISHPINVHFDVAIGYLELWSNYFVVNKVNATKKILWIHTDYKKSKLIPSLDKPYFEKANYIITVSKESSNSLSNVFPTLTSKIKVVENIVSPNEIIKMSNEGFNYIPFDNEIFNIVTVSRLDMYTKGIDRIIKTVVNLKIKKYRFKWYIIGDGRDRNTIQKSINKGNISEELILLGEYKNPFPFVKRCNVFVLPSRFEGKPIAVTEAQILGLPVIVSNYSSAIIQVNNYVDGIIVDLDCMNLTDTIEKVILNGDLLKNFSNNLKTKDFHYQRNLVMERFNKLIFEEVESIDE